MAIPSRYPQEESLIEITQGAGLKRTGLVASKIFPEVPVNDCKFKWVDWATTESKNGRYDNLKKGDDLAGCYGTPKSIDPSSFKYGRDELEKYSLSIDLKECCPPKECNTPVIDPNAAKTEELTDRLLIGREQRAVSVALDESAYTDQTGSTAEAESAEGAMFKLPLWDESFDILKFFQNIQEDNHKTGIRNLMTTNLKIRNGLMRHPSLKDGGCAVPLLADQQYLQDILGINEVVIADAAYNSAAVGANYALERIWGDYILLTKSLALPTTESHIRTFGFSANMQGFNSRTYFDDKMGPEGGFRLVSWHDYTEVVADRSAATLIKVEYTDPNA